MLTEPEVITRDAQPYVAIRAVIDMERAMEVEVGAPVAAAVTGDGQVLAGVLPAGRYATLRYTGHPDGLFGATVALLDWAKQQNLTWDVSQTEDGDRWGARLEIYETDPAVEPDMTKWTTQLAFRLAD
jgi:effector-binding domain-containing protein